MADSEIPTPANPKLVDHAIDESAVPSVADAIEAAYQRGCLNWNTEARAAIAAARPILTGPLRDENTRLRAERDQARAGLASCEYLLPYGHEDAQTCDQPCHPSTDRCPQHDQRHLDYIASLTGEIKALRAENERLGELWHEVVDTPSDGGEAQIWLRRWMVSGSSIADDPDEYGDCWFINVGELYQVIRAYLVANNLPVSTGVRRETFEPPAALRAAAPSAPEGGNT